MIFDDTRDKYVNKMSIRITFRVAGAENVVGIGVIFGSIFHSFQNRDAIFSPQFDVIFFALLIIHMSGYVSTLGTFLYQLGFFSFRYFNEKLMQEVRYRIRLEKLIQVG